MSENIIPIDSPFEAFKSHLEPDDNRRIFFSGPFGIGKTFFLKEFFKENEEYSCIHLYPVNYSVAQSEDIFELIKYDILYELLTEHSDSGIFDKDEIADSIMAYFFLLNNGNDILSSFIEGISKISEKLGGFIKIAQGLEKLEKINLSAFKKYKEKHKNHSEESKEYLDKLRAKTGSIYERDYYTQLICSLISNLAEVDGEKKRKTVLIIDDLDRIDPEHIFRILNVFSAHFDGSENKFGFDRIIIVGHYENIQSIFYHKYGINTDFEGYTNKFYSNDVFIFSNQDAIQTWLYKEAHSLPLAQSITHCLGTILYILAENQQVSTRNVIKLLKISDDFFSHLKRSKPAIEVFLVGYHYEILRFMYGTSNDLIKALRNAKPINKNRKIIEGLEELAEWTIPVIAFDNSSNYLNAPNDNQRSLEDGTQYRLRRDGATQFAELSSIPTPIKTWNILIEAFNRIKNENMLDLKR